MFSRWKLRADALQMHVEALGRRIEALEDERVAFRTHRDQLLTAVASSEARLRAMLSTKKNTPTTDNGTSLDAALLKHKGY